MVRKSVVLPLSNEDAREDFNLRALNKQFVYYVSEIAEPDGTFRPSVVIEREPGRYPLNYTWNTSFQNASALVDKMNMRMGIDKRTAYKIVASSMGVTKFGAFRYPSSYDCL